VKAAVAVALGGFTKRKTRENDRGIKKTPGERTGKKPEARHSSRIAGT